jgi:hypothetical protein
VASDANRYFCLASVTPNVTTGAHPVFTPVALNATFASNTGLWLGTGYAGTGSAIRAGIMAISAGVFAGSSSAFNMTDPAPGSSQRYFATAYIVAESMIRGRLRGMYLPMNNLSAVANFTQISGASGVPAGSVLELMGIANSSSVGRIALETVLVL